MIKNIEKFHEWIRENSKAKTNNMKAWEDDLLTQIGSTGADSFEMSARETKSGKPETISFNREIITDADGELVEENIIF